MGCVLRKIGQIKSLGKCVICSFSFNNQSNKMTLRCGHTFHKNCIRDWFLKIANNCPLCRKNI